MTDNIPNQSEIKDRYFSVKVNRGPGCHVALEVAITKEGVLEAYEEAIKAIRKEVSMPGFRKGKAPQSMIVDRFAKAIEKEWKEIVTKNGFYGAINLAKLEPFSEKSIKKVQLKNCSKEEGATLSIEYVTFPKIPEIDPSQITLEKIEKSGITEEKIDAEMENVRSYFGTFEPVEDRPSQDGDFVTIDLEIIEEDSPMTIAQDERFELSKEKMVDWLYPLIIGIAPSEQKEGMAKMREDSKELKKCRVTLKKIEKKILPPFDDELAKKIGLTAIDELRPKLKERLEEQAKVNWKAQMRERLKHALPDSHIFDLPSGLVEAEIKHRQEIGREGSNEELRKEAEDALRLHFLLREYAKKEKIEVTQEEISREYMHQMRHLSENQRSFSPDMDGKEIYSRILLDLQLVKAMDDIIAQL